MFMAGRNRKIRNPSMHMIEKSSKFQTLKLELRRKKLRLEKQHINAEIVFIKKRVLKSPEG